MADREDAQADEPITQRGLNIRILQRLQNDDVERAQRQEHSIELHNRLMEESRQREEESRARIRHQDEMIALITRLVGAGTPQPAAEPAHLLQRRRSGTLRPARPPVSRPSWLTSPQLFKTNGRSWTLRHGEAPSPQQSRRRPTPCARSRAHRPR